MAITKQQLLDGIAHGTVKFICDPNFGSGTVCQIGDNWFYFGGFTAEEESPEVYLRNSDMEQNLNCILEVMHSFQHDLAFVDEYRYYEAVLAEMTAALEHLTNSIYSYGKRYNHQMLGACADASAATALIRENVRTNQLSTYLKALLPDNDATPKEADASSALRKEMTEWLAVNKLYPVISPQG